MSTDWVNLHALWRIVVVGLLAGAGLPALFAVGLRALAMAPGGATSQPAGAGTGEPMARNPLGVVAAVLCFAVVVAGVAWGVYLIVDGT